MRTIVVSLQDLPLTIVLDNSRKDYSILCKILGDVYQETRISPADIVGRCRLREICNARSLFIKRALEQKFSQSEIAQFLGRCPDAINHYRYKRKIINGT